MSQGAGHVPVMLAEVQATVAPEGGAGRVLIDATFGAGGYSRAFLESGARVVAFDRDPVAAVFAAPLNASHGDRLTLIPMAFSDLQTGWAEVVGPSLLCDGVAFDLGVSSMQVDEAERGFSFMRDGPLDMRMGRDGPTAADLVNTTPIADLARLLRLYGEEPNARRISSVLVRRRIEAPFTRTLDLAETVERAVGGRRGAPTHPATRTFQALRIAVNDELGELEAGLDAAERVLAPEGRLAVVTFHSLEDRIVKQFFAARSGRGGQGSRHRPGVPVEPVRSFEPVTKGPVLPSEAETARNPRARSAKLRAGARTDSPVPEPLAAIQALAALPEAARGGQRR